MADGRGRGGAGTWASGRDDLGSDRSTVIAIPSEGRRQGVVRRPVAALRPHALIGATMIAAGVWMAAAKLSLDWRGALVPVLACVGLEGLAAFYTGRRPEPRIAATLRALAQIVAFSAAGECLCYAAAATGGPLRDAALWSWDQALGLDWPAYLAFVDARPWLRALYALAYQSLTLQFFVVVTILGFSGRLRGLRDFVLAMGMTGLGAILVFAFMPAMSAFFYLGLKAGDFPNVDPAGTYTYVPALSGLRDGTLRVVSLSRGEGIITFPSYHAALGVLFALALWPVPWVRWPALALNLVMIAATPVIGNHYFVDVIAGCGLAVLAMGAARRLDRGRARAPGIVAGPAVGVPVKV